MITFKKHDDKTYDILKNGRKIGQLDRIIKRWVFLPWATGFTADELEIILRKVKKIDEKPGYTAEDIEVILNKINHIGEHHDHQEAKQVHQ